MLTLADRTLVTAGDAAADAWLAARARLLHTLAATAARMARDARSAAAPRRPGRVEDACAMIVHASHRQYEDASTLPPGQCWKQPDAVATLWRRADAVAHVRTMNPAAARWLEREPPAEHLPLVLLMNARVFIASVPPTLRPADAPVILSP